MVASLAMDLVLKEELVLHLKAAMVVLKVDLKVDLHHKVVMVALVDHKEVMVDLLKVDHKDLMVDLVDLKEDLVDHLEEADLADQADLWVDLVDLVDLWADLADPVDLMEDLVDPKVVHYLAHLPLN